jgi:hypothetical protein
VAKAVARTEDVAAAPPSTVVGMIGAVVARPDVDVGKIADLLKMQREAEADAAKRAFMVSFNEVQKAMVPVLRDAPNGQTKSKYATHEALDRALRPVYTAHGFSLSFNTADSPLDQHVRVVCYLQHVQGHEKTYQTDIPCDGKGAKGNDVMTKTHAVGSAMTYGKRYLLALAFNIALTDTDDDGNGAGGRAPDDNALVSVKQRDELLALADEVKADKARFCKFYGIASFADIRASQFENAKAALNAKRKKS